MTDVADCDMGENRCQASCSSERPIRPDMVVLNRSGFTIAPSCQWFQILICLTMNFETVTPWQLKVTYLFARSLNSTRTAQ